MAHRIEIELTSQTGESTWTWRAAGAKQPRGTLDASLVPEGSGVGSVLRAEVETTLDGTAVTALMAPKGKAVVRPVERIEIIGTPQRGPDVNVVLASKGKRRRDEGSEGHATGPAGPGRAVRSAAPGAMATNGVGARVGAVNAARTEPPAPTAPAGGPARPGPVGGESGGRDNPRRLTPSTTYRNAALATLKPEQLPVAEQLLQRGDPLGAPGHRGAERPGPRRRPARGHPGAAAVHGRAAPPGDQPGHLEGPGLGGPCRGQGRPLRELRSIVASSSTVTLDDEGSEMATALRTSLTERVTALRERWLERIGGALDDGRVVDAVRASIRPPEPAARLTAELAVRLADAAGSAMSSETPPAEWLALLEVVVESPVRRTVKPAGLPVPADDELLAAARKASGHVPELARLMGIPIPPPPGPRRPVPARSSPGRRAS